MGRHRRSAAGPTAEMRTVATVSTADRQHSGRRKKRAAMPIRTGLLGVSAALAVGAVAVSSGLVPGGGSYNIGGGAADEVRHGGAPDLLTQGGSTAEPADRTSASASASAQADRGGERPAAPSRSAGATPPETPSASTPQRTGAPEQSPDRTTAPDRKKAPADRSSRTSSPVAEAPAATKAPPAPKTSSAAPSRRATSPAPATDASAQAAVLALVNQERSKAGCSPVTTSGSLTALAQAFSEDMAARGFFSHTDPDGATPWDRAAKAGIQGLGGENIARGQADAQAVMEAWMNSEGHRANILNCDYKTLGVGVHLGLGGPWWTQDFGF